MFKTIFMKEFKDTLRDRRSLMLVILMPIVMMTGLTFLYDKMLQKPEADEFTVAVNHHTDPAFVQKLKDSIPDIKLSQVDNVKEAIDEKEAQAGITVEKGWQTKLQDHQAVQVELHYDPASQKSEAASNLVTATIAQWQTEMTSERLKEINADSNITTSFVVKNMPVKNEEDAFASMMLGILIPILIPIAIVNGGLPAASELFAGEKEKKTMEALLITPVKPGKILLAKWSVISLLGIFTGILCITVLSVEIQFTENLKNGFSAIQSPVQFFAMSLFLVVLFATMLSALISIPSMLANSIKESGYYTMPVMGLITVPILGGFMLGDTLNIWLYAVPSLNLFLFVRDAFSQQLTTGAFFIAIGSYVALIVILFPFISRMFKSRKVMLGK